MASSAQKTRIPELDGLRGLAAVLVVALHLWPDLFFFGWAAVDLFFVLSGYLITRIILENGGKPGFIGSFYARRSLRIWPIYYLAILGLLLCTRPEPGSVPYYLVYLQNIPLYWGAPMPVWHEFAHAWTLALEEQFYLIWPALLLVLTRRAWVGPVALTVACISITSRALGLPVNLLVARCDGFALGGVLAALVTSGKVRDVWLCAALAAIGGVVAVFWSILTTGVAFVHLAPLDITASTLTSFAIVASVAMLAGRGSTRFFRAPIMVYLGTISYGLYLYHYPIILRSYSLTLRLGVHGTFVEPFLLGGISLVVAMLSWHLIESPILGLKRYFSYGRRCSVKANARSESVAPRETVTAASIAEAQA